MTVSKNEGSKRGDMALANKYIESALLGMGTWITKSNLEKGFGQMFLDFMDSMRKYYSRTTGQSIRQTAVTNSVTPLQTVDNALKLYVRESHAGLVGLFLRFSDD